MYFVECACGAKLITTAAQMRGTCDDCDEQMRDEAEEACTQISQAIGRPLVVADVWRTGDRLADPRQQMAPHGPWCLCAACLAKSKA